MTNILLVEDDLALTIGIEYALKSAGFSTNTAKNVEDAKAKLLEGKYDLILLDVMLPDGSGYDLCREIRKDKDIPIIFLTACDEEANVVMGLDLGGDDYLTKPIRIRELTSRINAVLRRNLKRSSNKTSSNNFFSEDIRVDILKCKVTKGDKEIFLTAVEYKLLLALMKNSGQVLLRNSILDILWDIDGDFIDDNTLSVYVRRLREKIEDDSKSPKYIVTARGLGYKWDKTVRGEM